LLPPPRSCCPRTPACVADRTCASSPVGAVVHISTA
jgi:hypothetical protein